MPRIIDTTTNEDVQISYFLYQHVKKSYFYYVNQYGLEYIATGIWKEKNYLGTIRLGPFISNASEPDFIKDMIIKSNLPVSERKHLEQFYQSLPVLSETEYESIGEMLVNLCSHPFIESQKVSIHTEKELIQQRSHVQILKKEDTDIIEERYEMQNSLMKAIEKGDQTEANRIIHSTSFFLDFSERIPGRPIRTSKNLLIVSNTLYRIAAEKAGVHPVYLHSISERFAILIERATTIPQLQKLNIAMVNEYCDLVNSMSTGKYTPIIKKAIDYILLNLGDPLSREEIASKIRVNPSYLSRKFKEETGFTLTDFINKKRIDEAKIFLNKGDISITDIAFMVGFNDINYFSKVFKKWTTLTPTEFKKRKK